MGFYNDSWVPESGRSLLQKSPVFVGLFCKAAKKPEQMDFVGLLCYRAVATKEPFQVASK